MVRERYREVVVSIAKDAPQVLTLLDTLIGMGKYIPTSCEVENRKVFTCFLDSTVSGLLGESDSLTERSSTLGRIAPVFVAKKRTPFSLPLIP